MDAGSRLVFTVALDGTTLDWYRFPDLRDRREFGNGEVRWTADRTGLWVIDQIVDAYRLVRVDAPGATPIVVASWPYRKREPFAATPVWLAGASSDDRTVVVARPGVENGRLLMIDTVAGTVVEIADPPGGFAPGAGFANSFAGWASVGDR